MYKTYSWNGKTFYIVDTDAHSSHMLKFDQTVREIIDYGELLIVMTEYMDDDGTPCYENIFGIVDGKTVWTIENFLHMFPNYGRQAFGGIRDYGNGEFIAIDMTGRRFIYSVQTGKIIRYLDWMR